VRDSGLPTRGRQQMNQEVSKEDADKAVEYIKGYIDGCVESEKIYNKSVKTKMFIRSFFVILVSPAIISVGVKLLGTSFLSLLFSALFGGFIFHLTEEAMESLKDLLQKKPVVK
jgi:hypothetical protein